MTLFGIDRLLADPTLRRPLEGQRVALLAHPASVTADLTHSIDALRGVGLNLSAAFGPQHGIKGDKQDNMVETPDEVDARLGIPVFSLYGEVRRPSGQMMSTFDTILIDLQDLGCRIAVLLPHVRQQDVLADADPARDSLADLTGSDDDDYALHGCSSRGWLASRDACGPIRPVPVASAGTARR